MTLEAGHTVSSSALGQHQTHYHGGGYNAGGYGGVSHASVGIGVNNPYPVANILNYMAQSNKPEVP